MIETNCIYSSQELDCFAEELNRDGVTVIRDLPDPKLMEEWARAFDALFQERRNRPGGLAPREQSRYYSTIPWVAPFADERVFANPVILSVLDRVLGPDHVMVQLGADVPIYGSDYQEIHRDHPPLFGDLMVTPLYALAVNFPLVEVSEENGPFQMARGTHILPRNEGLARIQRGDIPLESFFSKPGDVTIRTPLALHRGTPNRADQPRPMVVMGYVRSWLNTPQIDLTIPRDYYESLPERTRRLLRCRVVERLEEKVETYLNFKF